MLHRSVPEPVPSRNILINRFLANNWRWFLWSLLILLLVSIPSDKLPKITGFMNLFQFDKLAHLLLFMILIWMMLRSAEKQAGGRLSREDAVFLCLLSGTLYGGATEIYQHFFIHGRIASWQDFIANETGCFAGWGMYKWRNSEIVK